MTVGHTRRPTFHTDVRIWSNKHRKIVEFEDVAKTESKIESVKKCFWQVVSRLLALTDVFFSEHEECDATRECGNETEKYFLGNYFMNRK